MPKNSFYLFIISIFSGLLAGVCSSLFLHSLAWVTTIRTENHNLIWGLPLFGFAFGHLIKRIPHHLNQGVPYILKELDNHEAHISPWMTPFIFISSLGTHLFGGSAGREGVGIIMGASMAHAIPQIKDQYKELRPYLIYSGIAAGFSSVFGTPIAGIFFAFELHGFKDFKKLPVLLVTIISSYVALLVPHFFGLTHQHFHVNFNLNSQTIIYILIAAVGSGIGGHIFYWGLKGYTKLISHFVPHVQWKLFLGGLAVSLLVYLTHSFDYIGLGSDFIAKSFVSQMEPYDFMMKCLLTVMTLSIGFKGGEVTPLFLMGATFSNSIASIFDLKNYSFSSALGMVSIFGAVTGTPIASGVMGVELFGWKTGVCSLICCLLARLLMGHRTVYRH